MPARPFQLPTDMSVRAYHMAARVYLKAQGIVNPEWQAELLIGGVLGLKRHELYLESERSVRPTEAAALRDVVTRRANHEPTQYILGQTEFYGLPFKCDRRALIPRPETELLVNKALLALAQMESPPKRVLDLGTGTGCIAIAIAANDRSAHVTATDAAIEPLTLAKENAHLNGVADRIDFVQSDLFAAVSGTYDLVVCNPPYIADAERNTLMPEVRDYEPPEALFAGPEGLDFIRSVLRSAPGVLVKGGGLLLEIGLGQADPMHAMAGESGDYSDVVITPDYQGHLRVFSARRI